QRQRLLQMRPRKVQPSRPEPDKSCCSEGLGFAVIKPDRECRGLLSQRQAASMILRPVEPRIERVGHGLPGHGEGVGRISLNAFLNLAPRLSITFFLEMTSLP